MILRELLNDIEIVNLDGDLDLNISGISFDSNKVKDGFLFVALTGENADGHSYIDSAVKNGAKALVVEKVLDNNSQEVSVVQVNDSRVALAGIAANFFRHPTKELILVGITGTNGKTTITYLLESIWKYQNNKCGIIGTIDYRYGEVVKQSSMTTPESLDLMGMFREMREQGVEAVAMEVSSHAIDKQRVMQCDFDVAVFTNLTQDHLDYHNSMEDYFGVKKRLFTEFLQDSDKEKKCSIINIDDPFGARLAKDVSGNIITYSIKNNEASVYARTSTITTKGIEAQVITPKGEIQINSTLFGEHNLSNILAAVASACSLGIANEVIEKGLSSIATVPGRLEAISNDRGFQILVDYAHTPDALKNVLLASRPLTQGRLILVFGCGGDRDNAKRPLMGKIGKEMSDVLIATSDNPRTEDPEIILDHIEEGISQVDQDEKPYFRIADRAQAIKQAIKSAKKNDTILIAGKGHEDYQIIGTTKYPFDDRGIAREALKDI